MPKKKCVLYTRIRSSDLGIGFRSLTRPRSVSLVQVRRLTPSILGRCVFIRLPFCVASNLVLCRWGTSKLGASSFISALYFFLFFRYLSSTHLTLMPHIRLLLAAKTRPKLKSKYKSHVKSATEYTGTIDDVDKLINPKMLAHRFLGPEPSPYVLRIIAKEEKSKYSSFRTLVFLLLVLLLTPCSW